MKRNVISLLTVLMLTFALLFVACGGPSGGNESSGSGSQDSQITSESSSSSTTPEDSSSTTPEDSSSTKPEDSSSATPEDSSSTPDVDPDPEVPDADSIAGIKALIDKNPSGVAVEFSGIVVGFDSMGYAHVGDESGIIYVRAKHELLTKGAFVKISGTGFVYTGSTSYPEYTRQIKEEGIVVEQASGTAPQVKGAQELTASDLVTKSESADIGKAFHGNLVTVTGWMYVGSDKYSYYLLDDEYVNMIAIHHYSQFFSNSVDSSKNSFNALDGKKITITGLIYRYYTAERIWTLQYISDSFDVTIVDEGGGSGGEVEGEYCTLCGRLIEAGVDHSICECGHCAYMTTLSNHAKCAICDGYMCDGEDHDHDQTLSIANAIKIIDQNPDGVGITVEGVLIGTDIYDYMHISDSSGTIYVRHAVEYGTEVGDYIRVRGKGQVYRGSETYPEYTRQIVDFDEYSQMEVTKLESDPVSVIEPVVLTSSDLRTTSESADIGKSFHGNPVQITGTVSVGEDKYSYYLLDDDGNKMVGLHHLSQYFWNSTDPYRNSFNALEGQKVTLNGVIYRYYTKENIWTFQYIAERLEPNYQNEYIVDGVIYEMSSDGTYAIAKGQVYGYFDQHVEILAEFNGVPVKEVGGFASKRELLSVKIPNSVTTIRDGAFKECPYLRDIIIGSEGQSELRTIEAEAFEYTAIAELTLPKTLRKISFAVFNGCDNFDRVYFEGTADDWAQIEFPDLMSNPNYYVSELYINGKILDKIILTSAVTKITAYAFYNFSQVTEVVIPDSVTSIGWRAFEGCNAIQEMSMPSISLRDDSNAQFRMLFEEGFKVPSSLKTVNITSGEVIYANFFRSCYYITTINLPEGITEIGARAFEDCQALTTINLPEGITTINSSAFHGCESLTKIRLPSTLETIGGSAFNGVKLTTVKIPYATKQIGSYAFYCETLTSIYLHSGIESMDFTAFNRASLSKVYFTGAETWEEFEDIIGISFDGCEKIRISYYTLD